MQVIKAILKDPEDKTQISLLYCNQMPEDILLWEELDDMAATHDNFKVWYCGMPSCPAFALAPPRCVLPSQHNFHVLPPNYKTMHITESHLCTPLRCGLILCTLAKQKPVMKGTTYISSCTCGQLC